MIGRMRARGVLSTLVILNALLDDDEKEKQVLPCSCREATNSISMYKQLHESIKFVFLSWLMF